VLAGRANDKGAAFRAECLYKAGGKKLLCVLLSFFDESLVYEKTPKSWGPPVSDIVSISPAFREEGRYLAAASEPLTPC
jgi:hypothetical protein